MGGVIFVVTFLMVSGNLFLLCLEKLATFKVIVLRRQEEFVGPSHYNIIRNTVMFPGLPNPFYDQGARLETFCTPLKKMYPSRPASPCGSMNTNSMNTKLKVIGCAMSETVFPNFKSRFLLVFPGFQLFVFIYSSWNQVFWNRIGILRRSCLGVFSRGAIQTWFINDFWISHGLSSSISLTFDTHKA